ncbi:DUF4383 domain-containing protein [Kibdelosporangium lantanae]
MTAQAVRARVQPTQVLAGLVALALLAYGIVGLTRTGFGDFTGSNHPLMGAFSMNPLLNVVYVVGGVVGLLLCWSSATSRLYGWIVLVASAALVVWGLMLVGFTSSNPVSELGNPLNLNVADNWLHVATGVLGLIVAVLPARRVIVEERPVVTDEPVAEPATEPVPAQTAAADTTDADEVEPEGRHRGAYRFSRFRNRSAH